MTVMAFLRGKSCFEMGAFLAHEFLVMGNLAAAGRLGQLWSGGGLDHQPD